MTIKKGRERYCPECKLRFTEPDYNEQEPTAEYAASLCPNCKAVGLLLEP